MITICNIPLPPKELSPNARPHYARQAKFTKAQRESAKYCAMEAVAELDDWREHKFPWTQAVSQVRWYRKAKRAIDADNAAASLKSTFDGIVDSGVLSDDRELVHLPIIFEHDKNNPRIEITLKKLEPGTCVLCGAKQEDETND